MSTVFTTATSAPATAASPRSAAASAPTRGSALATLVRRRVALSLRTPRELIVPLMTPVLFAVVIAPALDSIGPTVPGLDYMTFAALGTAGLLIPLNCMFAGLGALLDRESGARRDLLAAPIDRTLVVVANLVVAVAVTALQVGVLLGAAVLRGAELGVSAAGVAWFLAAGALLAIGMYGVAEVLAGKVATAEEYVGLVPAIAIVPFFFAGSLFPIGALPTALTAFAKVLPLSHTIALIRYGLLDGNTAGLHDIWGGTSGTQMACLSLGVVTLFAVALTALAVRTFTRTAVS